MLATAVASVCSLWLAGCGSEPEQPAAEPRRGSFSEAYEADASERPERDIDPTSLRNMSELLAGLVAEEDRDQLDPVWLEHAEQMDVFWREIDARHAKMRAWTAETLTDIGAPEAWTYGQGRDVIVAVLDTGVDATRPVLAPVIEPNGLDLIEHDDAPDDSFNDIDDNQDGLKDP
ncbi:MAG: hypothetical protein MI919_14095, partial [Holophagales bacterium]|nr:hypothetical protein [Holophagales bacterium]